MEKKSISKGRAIAGLLVNVLVMPGVGSLIAGKTNHGIIQLILEIVALVLILSGRGLGNLLIGALIAVGVWIWGLITGINAIKEAK